MCTEIERITELYLGSRGGKKRCNLDKDQIPKMIAYK